MAPYSSSQKREDTFAQQRVFNIHLAVSNQVFLASAAMMTRFALAAM